jgi:hypothetical protein
MTGIAATLAVAGAAKYACNGEPFQPTRRDPTPRAG